MEFIPYTQALELKELGFNEPCWAWYNISDEDVRCCYSEGRSPITNIQEEWNAKIDNKPVENIGLPTFSQAFKFFREKYKLHIEIRSYTARFFTIVIQECKDIVKYIEYGGINLKFNTYEEAEQACLERLIEITLLH